MALPLSPWVVGLRSCQRACLTTQPPWPLRGSVIMALVPSLLQTGESYSRVNLLQCIDVVRLALHYQRHTSRMISYRTRNPAEAPLPLDRSITPTMVVTCHLTHR